MHVRMFDPTNDDYRTWPPEFLRASWLPHVGPSTFLLGVMLSELGVGEFEVDEGEWAAALGIGANILRQSSRRLCNFNLGAVVDEHYVFLTRWAPWDVKVNHFRKLAS